MSQAATAEQARDHKHWLAEIERWEGYLQTWNSQRAAIKDGIESWIKAHDRQLEDHTRGIASLKAAIVDCERKMMDGSAGASAEVAAHRKELAQHDEQRIAHERLKHIHHNLMACLALLKAKPFREE